MSSAPHKRMVSRGRLVERLRVTRPRLVSIVAPAGYGKTTLARELIATFPAAAICDCLETGDAGDLARRLLRALAPHDPDGGSEWAGEQLAAMSNDGDWEKLAGLAWSRAHAPDVVLFDNAEWLADFAGVTPFFRSLLAGHARTIVLCARRPIALPFGHGIGPEDVAIVGPADLAFTREETAVLFADPAQPVLDRALTLTGGWPLVVGMIARMSERDPLETVLERIGGRRSDELSEYLVSQFVERLAEAELDVLVAAAAIPQPSVGELSVVLHRDCSTVVEELTRTLPMATNGGTVELHPLLREIVRYRFAPRASDVLHAAVRHARAARDDTRVAELSLALGDHRAAASALTDVGPFLLSTPSLRVTGVLASLDESVLVEFPMLWCAALIHRGYALPPHEWLRTASAIWSRLDTATPSAVRASVASCVINGYTNMGRCADAAAFLAEFRASVEASDPASEAIVLLWSVALDSFTGRFSRIERATQDLMPVLASSSITHALYLYDAVAPSYRAMGRRRLEYDAFERAIELGTGSRILAFTIVLVGAAFGAWFAGEDDAFARYLATLESRIVPSVARGHHFFIECARGRGRRASPGYEKMRVRTEALLIAAALAENVAEALAFARQAVEAADASERPFYGAVARIARAILDPPNAGALLAQARTLAARIEAPPFRAAVDAVAGGASDHGLLGSFTARYARLTRALRIELRLFEGTLRVDGQIVALGDREYALLAELAREDRWHSGAELAGELFPDLDGATAQNRVYVYLHRMRKRFAARPVVITGRKGYRLSPDAGVDLWEADTCLVRAAKAGWQTIGDADRAELFAIATVPTRRRPLSATLERQMAATLRRLRIELARDRQAHGDWNASLALSKAMLADDACEESAHEIAIRSLLHIGNRPGALAQWAEYREAMRRELDVEPNPELRTLIDSAL